MQCEILYVLFKVCGMSESTFVDNLITASRINLYFTAKVKGAAGYCYVQ